MDNKSKKILITGVKGMVGQMLVKYMKKNGYKNILAISRDELNLSDSESVDSYFLKNKPELVYMIASKVGGIAANISDPVGFLNENLKIIINLFESCKKHKTEKNLFVGSSCIYPKACPQPIKEEHLMTGLLEPTNEGYSLSKIVGLRLAEFYFQQYEMLTISPMPCNIYGTGDHFDLQKSHVLSALVKRFVDAYDESNKSVTLWGTGSSRREFIHVEDVSRAFIFLMEYYNSPEIINLGTGTDLSIKDLAHIIADHVGFHGNIIWDDSKPDGMPKKCLDTSKLKALGFTPKISLDVGIQQTINEYKKIKLKNFREN